MSLLRFCWKTTVGVLLAVQAAETVSAQRPVLTGRWGDTAVPEQLAYNYESRKCRALVVVTASTACPLVRRNLPGLNDLSARFAAEGVQFIGLFTNGVDNLHEIAEYAVEHGVAFPVYKDDADTPWHAELRMKTTPQVVVLDTRLGYDASAIVYRGQINGMWFGGGSTKQRRHYLRDALESFLAGQPVPIRETAASGCLIAKDPVYDLSGFQGVTYHNEIARLVQRRCASCHREGEPGAELFSTFDSYEDVAGLSAVMLNRIENRLMPPWHATPSEETDTGGFKNDPRLSKDEIKTFRAWVENGCPAGDPGDAPAKRTYPNAQWQIGTPDLVFEMPEPYQVPQYQLDEYQYYRVPARFEEDRYIQAIEVQPGNKAIVHHIGVIVGPASKDQLSSTQAMLRLYGLTGEKVRKVGDYVAGDPFNARTYPRGYALRLPARQDLYFEMHYTPTGRVEEPDISRMGIIWSREAPDHVLETKVFNRKDLRLRPHDGHYEKRNYFMLETDALIHALAPHMHFRGKDFTLYRAKKPGTSDETRELILRVSAYDFNWQRTYEFKRPLRLRAGEALFAVTHFDNSHYNPNNPDPEATVRYGLLSEEEMLNLRVKYEKVDFGEQQ
ncbi:MAG: hypothetical protein AAGA92_06620 [Planctomycetota bacterium]